MHITKRLVLVGMLCSSMAICMGVPRAARLAIVYQGGVGDLASSNYMMGTNTFIPRILAELFKSEASPILVNGDVARFLFDFIALRYQDPFDLAKDDRIASRLPAIKKCEYDSIDRAVNRFWRLIDNASTWSKRFEVLRKMDALTDLLLNAKCDERLGRIIWRGGFWVLHQLARQTDWSRWHIYMDQSPEKFVLFVPESYVADMKSGLSATSDADAIGFAIDHREILRPITLSKGAIGEEMAAFHVGYDPAAPELALSLSKLFKPNFLRAWNILMLGHGGPCEYGKRDPEDVGQNTGDISGMPAAQFLQSMLFFNQLPVPSVVTYETCFGGGSRVRAVEHVLARAGGQRLYVVSVATTDDVTSVNMIDSKHFFDALEGGLGADSLVRALERIEQATASVGRGAPITLVPKTMQAEEAARVLQLHEQRAMAAEDEGAIIPAGVISRSAAFDPLLMSFEIQDEVITGPWVVRVPERGGVQIKSALPGEVEHRITSIETNTLYSLLRGFFHAEYAPGFFKMFNISRVRADVGDIQILGDTIGAAPVVLDHVFILVFPRALSTYKDLGRIIATTKDEHGNNWLVVWRAKEMDFERIEKRLVKPENLAAELKAERDHALALKS